MDERERARAAREHELRNIDRVFRILVDGPEEDVEEIRALHGLSPEQVSWLRHYAKLRDEAHRVSDEQAKLRKRDRPALTDEENDLGCYLEDIEPQVREAVLAARRKGYRTIASGFAGVGELQHLHFGEAQDPSILPPELVDALANRDVSVWLDPRGDTLLYTSKKNLSMEELASVWKEITDAMPGLGHPAGASDMPVATTFRKEQKKPQG